jgi:hypothetical protein
MDRLPVELLSIVVAGLQEWDVSDEPFAHLTGTATGNADEWLVHTVGSRQDICDFRLVCRKFYNSSFHTFGELLGNKVFRITPTGLEDLQAISNMARMRPYIRRLTWGTSRCSDTLEKRVMQEVMHALPEPDKAKLLTAYSYVDEWRQTYRGSLFAQELAQHLRRLPNLRSLSILISDFPVVNYYLGHWPSPSDTAMVTKSFSDSLSSLVDQGITGRTALQDHLTWLAPLFDAIKTTKTTIQDLRLGINQAPPPNEFLKMLEKTGMVSSLRHLRLDIDVDCLRERESFQYGCLELAFQKLSAITHLTLSMVQDGEYQNPAQSTRNFIDLLRPLNHLQHLTIRGAWWYSEDVLVDLISSQSASLTLLSLKGGIMDVGDWSTTLQRLVQLEPHTLRYLEVSAMSTISPNNRLMLDFVDCLDWDELISSVKKPIEEQGTCSVYLRAGTEKYLFEPLVG